VETAFALAPGRVADRVIETEHGFEIAGVAREEPREASFEDLRDSIRRGSRRSPREGVAGVHERDLEQGRRRSDEKALEQLASETAHKRSR
jgi:hypothetical protein